MQRGKSESPRYKNRREAERVLTEIVEDGGDPSEFQIVEAADGSCLIVVFDLDGHETGRIGT